MHQTLFIELYRLHERQINRLCKAMFYKVWRVQVCDVDAFFMDGALAVDGWRLFEAVFEESWMEASGCSEVEHKNWVHVGDQLFHESVRISLDKIEEGCVYLCGIIQAIAKWGRAQEKIEYDGITSLGKIGVPILPAAHGRQEEEVRAVGKRSESFHSKKWDELKSKLQAIQKS